MSNHPLLVPALAASSLKGEYMKMKLLSIFGMIALIAGTVVTGNAEGNQQVLVVTTSNTTNNRLLVYNTTNQLIQTVSTKGQGGASGNAGGIAGQGSLLAVVNFGSQSVSLFERPDNGFCFQQLISTASNPLSVAFGRNYLYILGTTTVESHRLFDSYASASADGVVTLLKADGSSAQVGLLEKQLIITEKSNVIETVGLNSDGAVVGTATAVQNIPTNVNAPFGLVTRGNDAYVTIAHADEISLIRNGKVLTTTPTSSFVGPVQHAPCWATLVGPFMYSSNSPSSTVSRYAVYGQKIVPDAAVAASFNGAPTDIASGEGPVAVIDGNGPLSHLSVFQVDEDAHAGLERAPKRGPRIG
jgi:hypothetical protein